MQSNISDFTKYKNIVILSGAGVSTNCGIPDFRGHQGVYTNNKNYNNDNISTTSLIESVQNKEPGRSHMFAKILFDIGILKRVYTQNIDGLYQKIGVPQDKIVEVHGNTDNVIRFGDSISNDVMSMIHQDFIDDVKDIDCIIIMGTSLKVYPFAALPNMVGKKCARYIVNNVNCYDVPKNIVTRNFFDMDRYEGNGLSSSTSTTIKIGKRIVSTQHRWSSKGKWKTQQCFWEDVDKWSQRHIDAFNEMIISQK
jgi:NAD-dependent SIR2 family protein deacetylase